MTDGEKILVALVFLWAIWLLWNGRANSPRRQREDARFQYLLEQAKKEQKR